MIISSVKYIVIALIALIITSCESTDYAPNRYDPAPSAIQSNLSNTIILAPDINRNSTVFIQIAGSLANTSPANIEQGIINNIRQKGYRITPYSSQANITLKLTLNSSNFNERHDSNPQHNSGDALAAGALLGATLGGLASGGEDIGDSILTGALLGGTLGGVAGESGRRQDNKVLNVNVIIELGQRTNMQSQFNTMASTLNIKAQDRTRQKSIFGFNYDRQYVDLPQEVSNNIIKTISNIF